MMETNEMTKKFLDFQKGAFSSWYGVMTAMQEQAVSSLNTALDQSEWMPDEGRRMVMGWVSACKDGCESYKGLVEDSFSGLENVLVKPSKNTAAAKRPVAKAKPAAPATPKKPVAKAQQAAPATLQKPAVEPNAAEPAKAPAKDKVPPAK